MLDTIGHCPHQILLFEEKSWRHSKTQSLSGGFRSSLGWRRSHHHHPHHDHDHPQHPLRDYQVAQVKGGNGGDWVAVDAREMPKELAKKEDNKGGGGRLRRKRVKSEKEKSEEEKEKSEEEKEKSEEEKENDNKDREMVANETPESSGYSCGEKDYTNNVIYYKVRRPTSWSVNCHQLKV